jgi:hypothetical protein
MTDLRRLLAESVKEIITMIFTAPLPRDPAAPDGFLTVELVNAELRYRFDLMHKSLGRLVTAFEDHIGPEAGAAMRQHVAELEHQVERELAAIIEGRVIH